MRVLPAILGSLAAMAALVRPAPARAELVLSELIVDLQPGQRSRDDIEVWNDSPDRSYVAIEPREITEPGLASQSSRQDPDPEKLGLLVAPARMILDPGQRKLVRIAVMGAASDREHVYRVTVKPVVGGISSDASGLKIMVGYDVLVLVRPSKLLPSVNAARDGRTIAFANAGNVSVELIDGRQCSSSRQCTALPGKRLYPGASWSVQLPSDLPAEYVFKSPGHADRKRF